MSLKQKELGAWLFFISTSFACAIWLFLFEHLFDDYTYIFFLPLAFFLCSVVFVVIYSNLLKNIGLMFLHCLTYIRMVVTPFLMTHAGYSSIFNGISEENINYAIILLCYECIMVYLVLAFLSIRSYENDKKIDTSKIEYTLQFRHPNFNFMMIVTTMTLYCVAVWMFIPTCRDLYKTIFQFSDISFTSVDYAISSENVGSLTRSAQTLFKMFFDIIRIVLPMSIIISFKRREVYPLVSIAFGVIFAFLQLLFISQTTARAIICAFMIIYFISKLYPKYAKLIVRIAIIAALFVIVLYFAIRFNVGSRYGTGFIEYMSKTFNAYFGGVDNVAAGANLPEGYEASTFWASLYSAIPFNSTLFGLKVENLQSIYNAVNHSFGQIPPMVVEGAYYFGELFAPVMSCICAFCAYHFGERFYKTDSSWYLVSYLFLAIIFALSIVMYNEEILLKWLLEWLVPMKILSKLADQEGR